MANESTSTTLAESMVAERVSAYIRAMHLPARIARNVAWRERGQLAVPHRFLRWDAVDLTVGTVPAKTEGAAAARIEFALSEASATPVIVSFEIALTDEARKGSHPELGVPIRLVEQGAAALANRRDSDILAVSTGATNTSGAFTDTLTLDAYHAGLAALRALEPEYGPGGIAVILGHAAASAFRSAMLQTTAAANSGNTVAQGLGGVGATFLNTWGGAAVWESGNVAADSTGHSNVVTLIGEGSGLGIAEDLSSDGEITGEDITIEFNRGSEGAREAENYMVFRAVYGAVLTDPGSLVELRST